MRIGQYTDQHPLVPLPQPIPGWTPLRRGPRARVDSTMGGVVAHMGIGYPGDEVVTLRWEWMLAAPSIWPSPVMADGRITTTAEVNVNAPFVLIGERLAAPIAPAPAAFYACGAARIWLQRVGAVGGYVTVDVWSDDGAGAPDQRLGTLGYMAAGDIALAWAGYEFWGDFAWPVDEVNGAHLVLSAAEMTGAGQIQWGASNAAPAHQKYTAGAWGGAVNQELSATTWQASPFNTLRGLVAVGNTLGGGGPNTVEVDLEDGQLYTAVLLDIDGQHFVKPHAAGGAIIIPPASEGVARRISLTIGITDELEG